MHITFEELRAIKHALPTGSISKMSEMLDLPEQTIRNYFGAHDYQEGGIAKRHIIPGPNGGYVVLEDTQILDTAKNIIAQTAAEV